MQVTFPVLLFLVFLVLKLTNVIAWSWWWVTAPIWIPLMVSLVVVLIAFAILGGINLLTKQATS